MAVFKRDKKRGLVKKAKEMLWPSQGWGRTFHYYRHRLFRTGDSTYRITAGLALGGAVSFVPLIGTHLIQVALFGLVMRTSFIAAFIGTALGNPWTFPFLFWLSYKAGVLIMTVFGWTHFAMLPDFMTYEYFSQQPMDFMAYLWAHPLELFLPMLLGGYICAVLFWPLAYGVLYYPVKTMQKAYHSDRVQGLIKRKKK